MAKFKQEILDKIKTDPDLFAAVAKAMRLKPQSLASTIDRNGSTLNQYSVVTVVASHLKMEPDDLLEEELTMKDAQK